MNSFDKAMDGETRDRYARDLWEYRRNYPGEKWGWFWHGYLIPVSSLLSEGSKAQLERILQHVQVRLIAYAARPLTPTAIRIILETE